MKQLDVYYAGWGEDWPLGRLADDGRQLLFEYSPEALAQGLALSPINLPLRTTSFGAFPTHSLRLPGLVADSLPDGWGLLLMDRWFRTQGVRHPGPLDRLAFIGDRAVGALRFVPAQDVDDAMPAWDLPELARQNQAFLEGKTTAALQQLAIAGGSPQGARPKAMVCFDEPQGHISTHPQAPGVPWLVKFPAPGEHKEVCALEAGYAQLARACGLDMPPCRWFDLSANLAAFGVQRFDRDNGLRVPLHSLAGLLGIDFRVPGGADYTTFLRATRLLTRDQREVEKGFARAVFNVLFHNRDDHPKNIAWRLGSDRRWRLAPAFDLTFSEGPGGEHHMDICGAGKAITRQHLMQLADESGITRSAANHLIDQQLDQVNMLSRYFDTDVIRRATKREMTTTINQVAKLLSK